MADRLLLRSADAWGPDGTHEIAARIAVHRRTWPYPLEPEDLLQEARLAIHTAAPARQPTNPGGYAYTIAWRRLLKLERATNRRNPSNGTLPLDAPLADTIPGHSPDPLARVLLLETLRERADRDRADREIERRWNDGQSQGTIAIGMGVMRRDVETAMKRMRRDGRYHLGYRQAA